MIRIQRTFHKLWEILKKTGKIYYEIDGDQRAASFAFYAFFSLFPLLMLLVSIGARWVDPQVLTDLVIAAMSEYIPLNKSDSTSVFNIINGVVEARKSLGIVAVGGLLWSSTHFFHALVRGVNRAWHTVELDWWKVPLKNVFMLCILASAMVIGIILPVVLKTIETFLPVAIDIVPMLFSTLSMLLPSLMLFYAFMMLYKVSPRRKTQFREVWVAALIVTFALKLLQQLLLFYTNNIWHVNAIYGAMGILVVLLLWVYLCGGIIIFGGCLCAAQYTVKHGPLEDLDDR